MDRLAQSAEHKALNLVVVGSSPTVGAGRIKKEEPPPGIDPRTLSVAGLTLYH